MRSLGVIAALAALTLSVSGPAVTELTAKFERNVSAEMQTPILRFEGTTLSREEAERIAGDLKLRIMQQYSTRYKLGQFEIEFTDEQPENGRIGIDVNVFFHMLPKGDLSRYPDLRPETTSLYHIMIPESNNKQPGTLNTLRYELFDRADITLEETILTPLASVEIPL